MELEGRTRRMHRIYFTLHGVFCLALFLYRILHAEIYFAVLALAAPFFLLLPHLIFRVFRKPPVAEMITLWFLYSTLAFTIGMALQGYHILPYYDKLVHTLSGAFFSFLGLLIFILLMPQRTIGKAESRVAAAFSFSFSMMIAAVWEIYEYILSLFTTLDPQNVLTTGVHDTMQDILVCLIGAVLFFLPEYFYFRKGRKDLFMRAYEAFLHSIK